MAETTIGAIEQPVEETVTEQELETTETTETPGANDPSEGGKTVVPGIISRAGNCFWIGQGESKDRSYK